MKLAVALIVLGFLAPATASADPFGRLPLHPVASAATCLRGTGVPGELARWTPTGIELLRADAGGLTPTAEVALGSSNHCPEIAGQPDGAAVAASVVRRGATTAVRVAVRDPGGSFGAPVALALPEVLVRSTVTAAVAMSARGDALVVVSIAGPPTGPVSVLAFRRAPGGAFGPPQTLVTTKAALFAYVQAGADDAGGLTVAWEIGNVESLDAVPVEVAAAPPGGAFAAPQKVASASTFGSRALAVGADGRALLAVAGDDGISVLEREPGTASFGAPVKVGDAELVSHVALALAPGGAAVVAWQDPSTRDDAMSVATRTAPGRFGPARTASPGRPRPRLQGDGVAILIGVVAGATPLDQTDVRAAIAGSAFALAWSDPSGGTLTGGPEAATGALAGGPVRHQTLGSGVRPATSVAPLALADDRAAIAWSDGADAKGSERVHLAIAGAADEPSPAPPSLQPVAQSRQRVYPDQAIAVRVRCGGPCDVRARAVGPPDPHDPALPSTAVASRASAGPLKLELDPSGTPLMKFSARSLDVTLEVSAPEGTAVTVRHVRVPVTLRRSPPIPKPLGVRVRRAGDDLVVDWHTAFAARRVTFLAVAVDGKQLAGDTATVRGSGKHRFSVRLRGAQAATRVQVAVYGSSDRKPRATTLKRPSGGWRA